MQIKPRTLPITLPDLPHVHPILQRIYASRGIVDESQLQTNLTNLISFESLTNIDKACLRLEKALREQQRILIIGDFDADGATSSALVISALRAMGASHVEFLVPNRFEFGYGLTPGIVQVAQQWRPKLIITVDNGITSIDGVDAANQLGIDVLVTDHHLPGETLPNAYAIVNPNQKNDEFHSKSIAGVGVIFYTMIALRRHLINTKWFEEINLTPPNMSQFLDLVALGTVADVVPLDQNNRILVKQGLERIRQGLARPGIIALLEIANKQPEQIRETDLGFAIAPRLNAAGRLDDMALGIECLLSTNKQQAQMMAMQLNELNIERRKIEAEMSEQAGIIVNKIINDVTEKTHSLPVAFCLVDPSWHQGVIGILAGRLKDRHHRPVIIFAMVSETEWKGSARSINGLNIRDVLAAIDRDHPHIMNKFGGHAMAAGLSLRPESFNAFHAAFLVEVNKQLDTSIDQTTIYSDGELTADAMNIDFAIKIHQAGPWGQQFPEPLFDNVFEIISQRIVGQNHLKLTLALPQTNEPIDAIAFNINLNEWPNHRAKHVHAAYRLDLNFYQGRTKLQLIITDLEAMKH